VIKDYVYVLKVNNIMSILKNVMIYVISLVLTVVTMNVFVKKDKTTMKKLKNVIIIAILRVINV